MESNMFKMKSQGNTTAKLYRTLPLWGKKKQNSICHLNLLVYFKNIHHSVLIIL